MNPQEAQELLAARAAAKDKYLAWLEKALPAGSCLRESLPPVVTEILGEGFDAGIAFAAARWSAESPTPPPKNPYPNSETSKCRARLAKWCVGAGLDIGYGGDPIVPHAINMDMPKPYTKLGDGPLHLGGDCRQLRWFADGQLDWIFSSHLLEDFTYADEVPILREWARVLKPGGKLVLYLPIEAVYAERCRTTGQPHNPGHKNTDFCFETLCAYVLDNLTELDVIHHADYPDEYSFEVVLRKANAPVPK